MVVRYPHGPSGDGRRTRDGDVSPKAHQCAGVGGEGGTHGRTVGCEGFRRRPQIEPNTSRKPDLRTIPADLDEAPPRCGEPVIRRDGYRASCRNLSEVAVIADAQHRLADRGIDEALGQARGPQRGVDRSDEQVVHLGPRAVGVVQSRQIGITPEPGTGAIDVVELLSHRRDRGGQT